MKNHNEFQEQFWSNVTRKTLDRVYRIIKTEPICPNSEEWLGRMASIEVEGIDPIRLKKSLREDFAIEIPVFLWQDRLFLRFSLNAYNNQADTDQLIFALEKLF